METKEDGKIDAFFLVQADFSEDSAYVPQDGHAIWIKGADGEVDSMTYAEFRSHSRVLVASRPLPDGRVG